MKVVIVTLLLSYLKKDTLVEGGCDLNLNKDLPTKNDPVYLTKDLNNNLQLALPDNGSIILNQAQDLILACTGSKNSLISTGQAVTVTKCSSGSLLNVGGNDVSSANLNCSSRSTAAVKITNTSCYDNNSVIIPSGFVVGDNWFPLIDTCHNIAEANSHWSRHTLYGSRLAGSVIQSDRPGFSRGDKQLYSGFDPDTAYTQSNQEAVFARIYGNQSASKYIVKNQYYLARGHLSPDGDFLFGSWQMLTYFYVNVAPQWQSINAGYWLGVENNARKVAMNLKQDLVDITGTHGVLTLPDDNGVLRQAYLQGDRLPVPELFWKLLVNPSNNSCIVLISTNNPHLKSPPTTICPDICATSGWPILQQDLTKGYVYCCDYQNFKVAAPLVPNVNCLSVLKFK